MDNKNVFVAIALSMSVLLFWGAFFETPKKDNQNLKTNNQIQQKTESSITPNTNQAPAINQINVEKKLSREDSINKSNRIKIENKNIVGSISLEGGLIDDISFKNHKQKVDGKKNIEFLNPSLSENGFYVESGWANIGNKIKLPTKNSKWEVEGNKTLTDKSPITIKWDNKEGIVFKKKIELDEKYLFKISQEVQNKSSENIELYPYAQITRNKIPDDIQNFYISHEGFIGVFDDELKEDDYDDIEDNKIVRESNEGWLGITDKYWMTVLVPEKGKNFKSTFQYNNAFKANYIINDPVKINPSSNGSNNFRLFVAAKEVNTIDTYAESQNINKLDLVIDWGWFIFSQNLYFL